MSEAPETPVWHMCSDLPKPDKAATKIVRCGICGQFWKREYYASHVVWAPVTGKDARRLRRQLRVRRQR